MERRNFSVYKAISYGFRTFFDNFYLLFKVFLIMVALLVTVAPVMVFLLMRLKPVIEQVFLGDMHQIQILPTLSTLTERITWSEASLFVLTILFAILVALFYYAVQLGFLKLLLQLHDVGKSSIGVLFSAFDQIVTVFLATFLYGLAALGGFVLLIIPGIYWMLRFMFFIYFIIDKNVGVLDSLRMSWRITKGYEWPLFAWALANIVLGGLAALIPFAGLIVTPALLLSHIYIYRKLQPVL